MHRQLLATLLLASGLPLVAAAGAQDGPCELNTSPEAVAFEKWYVWVSYQVYIPPRSLPELWQESNGAPGLQRFATYCSDGTVVPRDACITHSMAYQNVACLSEYPGP